MANRPMNTIRWPQKFVCTVLLGVAWMVLCLAGQGQARDPQTVRKPEASELLKENNSRVAASAAQIKAVLAQDVGLLV